MEQTIITIDNAGRWAGIFELVNVINTLPSVNDFYCCVEPPCYGIKEVYDRLEGWHKEAFKAFVMSGDFLVDQWGTGKETRYDLRNWGYGRYNKQAKTCDVTIRKYPPKPADWEDYEEENAKWTWDQICTAFPI